MSSGVAIFLWIVGGLLIIGAFISLPFWWGRSTYTGIGTSGEGS
jgi:hypothetical protein